MISKAIALAIVAFTVCGCALPSLSGDVYSRRDAKRAYHVEYGEVIDVRSVYIEGEATGFGTFGGYIIGYEAGKEISDKSGLLAAAGGVAGAVAGRIVEKSLTGEPGLEITVELDQHDIIMVVQADDVPFQVGDDVRVLFAGDRGEARVQRRDSTTTQRSTR